VLTKAPWSIFSNAKSSMIGKAPKLAIEALHPERALGGAPVGTPSLCQWPASPSPKVDPHTPEAVTLVFC
jgi:hypothetical protein